jgi:glycosyltransferase involved in cell wall biosynthesis
MSDPAGVAAQIWGRLRHDPLWLLLQVDDGIPAGLRTAVYGPVHRAARWVREHRRNPSWSVLVEVFTAHGLGRRSEVVSSLGRAKGTRGRARVALARLATEIDEPRLALEVLGDALGPRALGTRARALERAGELHAAERSYAEALAHRRDPSIRERHERLRDDLRALDPGFAPAGGSPTSSFEPVEGRIVHLLNNALPQKVAGYTIRAHRTMLAQRAVGLDPVGLTKPGFPWAQGHLDARPSDEVDGIVYHHLRFDRLREVGTASHVEFALQAMAPIIERLRPAVLHPTTPFDNGQVALALRTVYDVPVVYEVRGFLEDTWLSRYSEEASATDRYLLHRATEGRVAGLADHVVTLGQAMKEDLVSRGVPPERITVVPNAVDVEEFRPTGDDRGLARELGIEGKVVMGYVSSLVPYEGVRYLLQAVAVLRDRGYDVAALIVGDGPDRAPLQRLAEELDLARFARFTGRVPPADVSQYYELMDLFVVPRTADRVCRFVTPLKPVEAMAMERCVVVSDIPALAETVRVGETGFTFEVENAGSLADVAEGLVEDRELRRQVGQRARAFVAAERSWTRNAETYRRIYRSIGAG